MSEEVERELLARVDQLEMQVGRLALEVSELMGLVPKPWSCGCGYKGNLHQDGGECQWCHGLRRTPIECNG